MVQGIASLHKILKDTNRQKIILALNERGNLSYTDLMEATNIHSTGLLNYHLKALGDLVAKNEAGKYFLTEKGNLAVRLLQEFGEKKSQSEVEAEFPKGFMVFAIISSVIYLSAVLILYLSGSLTLNSFILNIIAAISANVLLLIAEKLRRKSGAWIPKRQMLGAKITFMAAGAWVGAVIGFFGGGLMQAALVYMLRRAHIIITITSSLHNFLDLTFWILNPIIGTLIGGAIGYVVYKRSRYSKLAYYDPFAS
jgi:hypothetical protein